MVFFLPLPHDRWQATEHTSGPWDERFQHAGPPSALLARAVENCAPRTDVMVARMTVEILGPIPVGELTVTAELVRPGRSVELIRAVMSHEGREVARAEAWRIRRAADASVDSRAPVAPPLPEGQSVRVNEGWGSGYLQAMEWRWVRGQFTEPGPATVWARMRYPLVDGEQPSPLQRLMIVADSGNGVSAELDLATWHFINPELTVHLHREPVGEWICLDATTTISAGGVGLATSTLSDQGGAVAVGAQSLFIAPR